MENLEIAVTDEKSKDNSKVIEKLKKDIFKNINSSIELSYKLYKLEATNVTSSIIVSLSLVLKELDKIK